MKTILTVCGSLRHSLSRPLIRAADRHGRKEIGGHLPAFGQVGHGFMRPLLKTCFFMAAWRCLAERAGVAPPSRKAGRYFEPKQKTEHG